MTSLEEIRRIIAWGLMVELAYLIYFNIIH